MIHKRKILIVDDNIPYREMLWQIILQLDPGTKVQILWDTSHLRHYMTTGEDHAEISLIILGFQTLTADVAEVLQQLSGHPTFYDIPVAMYITSIPPGNCDLVKLGVQAYYVRPVKASEMKLMARQMQMFRRTNRAPHES